MKAIRAVKAKQRVVGYCYHHRCDGQPDSLYGFSLKRDAGTARSADYKFSAANATNMTVTPLAGARTAFLCLVGSERRRSAGRYAGLTLAEPGGIGVKSVLTAICIVPRRRPHRCRWRSPITRSGRRQGQYVRPCICRRPSPPATARVCSRRFYSELSVDDEDTSNYKETNETLVHGDYFNTGNYGACSMNQMAARRITEALCGDHLAAGHTTDSRLPIKKWWAGDGLLKNQTSFTGGLLISGYCRQRRHRAQETHGSTITSSV